MKFILVVTVALAVAGCASTPGGLKSNPDNLRQFAVSENYQEVFKRIVEAQQECRPKSLLPLGQAISDAQLYSDLKKGTLVVGASGVGTQIVEVVEVSESAPGKTVVDVYVAASRDAITGRYERWANGNPSCKI